MGAPEEGRGGLVEAGAALPMLSSPSRGSSRALLVAMPAAPRLHTPQPQAGVGAVQRGHSERLLCQKY